MTIIAAGAAADSRALADDIDAVLPQTQCTRCGYADCRHYADAIVEVEADIDRCPPGGAEGVRRLSSITGRPVIPLNPVNGIEGPRRMAVIDEDWCIGCTLCIKACPVDCIAGAPKRMHTVIEAWCTGCELCVPVCPVDCIAMVNETGELTGWDAWGRTQAQASRDRYAFHKLRLERDAREQSERLAAKAQAKLADLEGQSTITDPQALERKRAVIDAALARAREKAPDRR